MTDSELLRKYVETGSQVAFARLVDRHMRLVYWTCRNDVQNAQMAEDVSQMVFVLLSKKAASLQWAPSITGWLFHASRLIAKDVLKRERRRVKREEKVGIVIKRTTEAAVMWDDVAPWFNDALGTLEKADREAVLLRYFDDLSMQEIAAELGTTEDTARKRIARAVDRIRTYLAKRKVTVSAAVLVALLADRANEPIPGACREAILKAVERAQHGSNLVPGLLWKGMQISIAAAGRQWLICGIGACILTAGLVMVGVSHRDPTGTAEFVDQATRSTSSTSVRDEIDADYKSSVLKLTRMDISGDTDHVFPTCTETLSDGTVVKLQQIVENDRGNFAQMRRINAGLSLNSVDITGDQAKVSYSLHLAGTTKKSSQFAAGVNLTEDSSMIALWRKSAGGWAVDSTHEISERLALNGTVVEVNRRPVAVGSQSNAPDLTAISASN